MTADLSALIARLDAAEAGSRELDLIVVRAVGDDTRLLGWPPYTTSLDAALALAERVLPGWYFGVQQNRYVSPDMPDNWSAYLSAPRALDQGDIEGEAPTPALALCIAILKAKMETEK